MLAASNPSGLNAIGDQVFLFGAGPNGVVMNCNIHITVGDDAGLLVINNGSTVSGGKNIENWG